MANASAKSKITFLQPKRTDVTEGRQHSIKDFLVAGESSSMLRLSTAGSVDDGKSTLIGRLLHDSKNIYEDTLQGIERVSKAKSGLLDLAFLTDGLKAEREQGITIDVAYRYFSTPKRRFILADSPGHEQYTRNMATGASTADITIILIDARKGVVTQTKRHAFIAALLGVPRLLVAINKMDLVDYSERVFQNIIRDFTDFATRLGVKDIRFIPISALAGDNVVFHGKNTPWYTGETLMAYLENLYIAGDSNYVDLRFPVQTVLRPHQNYRGYAGQIRSGLVRVGDEVTILPSMLSSKIKSIDVYSNDPKARQLELAHAPMSVCLSLEDQLDISRGDMIVRSKNLPAVQSKLEVMLIWMSEQPLNLSHSYILMHTTREVQCTIDQIQYKVDVNTLSREAGSPLKLNDIGRLSITCKKPVFVDSYNKNRTTGNFILVDSETFLTVAAGMIVDRHLRQDFMNDSLPSNRQASNLHSEDSLVTTIEREARYGSKAKTIWCTGLSGSGKSTIAKGLERHLFDAGVPVYRLDGDNLRQGINRNLGFSKQDRAENIRRTAEVANLFNQAGITVICSLISPLREDRELAKEIIGSEQFFEVYIDAPLAICEERDPHGLYRKARLGEIQDFTGISAPYEPPLDPAASVDSSTLSIDQSINIILELLRSSR